MKQYRQESTQLNTIRTHHPQEVAKTTSRIQSESSAEEEMKEVIKKHAMEESLEDTQCPTKPITCFLAIKKRKASKRLSPFDQQTTMHQRAENHPVQIRFEPRREILAKAIGICEIFPQHKLRNTIEQNPQRQSTKANISKKGHHRDHNET